VGELGGQSVDELGGQSVDGIKSGVCCCSSATVSLARRDGHCPAQRRKTRFQMPHGCQEAVSVSEGRRDSMYAALTFIKNQRAGLNHAVIERAIGEWRPAASTRLRSAGDGHFEHMM